MNDIRRTILWVIFGFSMVLLWDKWQLHNGNKATFFPSPAAVGAAAPAAGASAPLAGAASQQRQRGAGRPRKAPAVDADLLARWGPVVLSV